MVIKVGTHSKQVKCLKENYVLLSIYIYNNHNVHFHYKRVILPILNLNKFFMTITFFFLYRNDYHTIMFVQTCLTKLNLT